MKLFQPEPGDDRLQFCILSIEFYTILHTSKEYCIVLPTFIELGRITENSKEMVKEIAVQCPIL